MSTVRGLAAATVARNKMLDDWLHSVRATCNWQQRIQHVGMLECWQANGRAFIVQRYEAQAGWEIYIPASSGIRAKDTFEAASKFIGQEA